MTRARALLRAIAQPVAATADRVVDGWRNREPVATVAINRRPVRAPWGGGNQWLDQIVRSLRLHGYSVRFDLARPVDCIVLADPRPGPTVTFDVASVAAYKARHPRAACIQRINDNDKHRKSDFRDAAQAEGNRVADHTVFISAWLRDYERERWFDVTKPHSVILNGADARVFHPIGRARLQAGEPMRIVTHHWSNNWNKGFGVYAELDRLIADGHLQGIELWVIGRWPAEIRWRAARTFPAMRVPALAPLLRQCHVYVTASRWESGGMHFIEGVQCGLPLLYHTDGGGIVELGRRFGMGFTDNVRTAVVEMRAQYDGMRRAVLSDPPSGDRMCLEYRNLIQQVITARRDTSA